jgi:hypothetical protein
MKVFILDSMSQSDSRNDHPAAPAVNAIVRVAQLTHALAAARVTSTINIGIPMVRRLQSQKSIEIRGTKRHSSAISAKAWNILQGTEKES